MEKTIVILIGNARGGEYAWSSLYTNLIDIYNADLFLCFGKNNNQNNSLYKKAKYISELEEYSDWTNYYNKYFSNNWKKSLLCGYRHGLAGGIENHIGSGAIIFAFRHFLKNEHFDILTQYDRIILTRSDHFYLYKHPILPNDKIWIPEGEDYNGITDRHHIFPSSLIKEMLGIVEYIDSDIGFEQINKLDNPNPEMLLLSSFKYFNLIHKIQRYKRCQFTVSTDNDSTRWQKGNIPFKNYNNLYIKYIHEYEMALKNSNE